MRKVGKHRISKKVRSVQQHKYLVEQVINERKTMAYADTGADINIMSLKTAKELKLPLQKTRVKIRPYGSKPLRCKGCYTGAVMHGEAVTNVKIYVFKKKVETLLSGKACEDLGIITFRRDTTGWEESEADDEEKEEIRRLNLKDKYRQKILQRFPDAFRGICKLFVFRRRRERMCC